MEIWNAIKDNLETGRRFHISLSTWTIFFPAAPAWVGAATPQSVRQNWS